MALLVFLLPGFVFSAGLYYPERFTRELSPRGPIGQVAAVLLAAVVVHSALFLIVGWLHTAGLTPGVNLVVAFSVLQLQGSDKVSNISAIAANIDAYRGWILLYLFSSFAMGGSFGFIIGTGISRDWRMHIPWIRHPQFKFRNLAQHQWVYSVAPNDRTNVWAYVLTNVHEGGRSLLYRGIVRNLGLTKEGKLSYVQLYGTERTAFDWRTDEAPPFISVDPLEDRPAEFSSTSVGDEESVQQPTTGRERGLFVIDGGNILNVVFDAQTLPPPPPNPKEAARRVSEVDRLEKQLEGLDRLSTEELSKLAEGLLSGIPQE